MKEPSLLRNIIIGISFILFVSSIYDLSAQNFKKIDRVVIDAGHGGDDPGTVGKFVYEKDIALSISLKVGKYIEENLPGVEIIYTRKTDVAIELYKRPRIANEKKADVFISIHCNGVKSTKAIGTETWIMGVSKGERNLAVAKKENSAILYEADYEKRYNNFDPNSPESYIIFELFQSAYREQSENLAAKVQNQFANKLHRIDRGVKEAGFLVLVNAAMPSILVETGFLTNPTEEKYLMSESGQNEIASGIYRAFKEYKFQMEKGNVQADIEKAQLDSLIAAEEKSNTAVSTIEKSDSTNIIFGVQFLTSKTVFKNGSAELKGVDEVWLYKDNDFHKYVSGKFEDINKANAHTKAVRASGFTDAFVVAFLNGERIPKRKALKMLEK